jgi:phosphate transport system protein
MIREKIDQLKEHVIRYSSVVREMVDTAFNGLLETNPELATKVIEEFEPRVNQIEIELDEECINAIALYQPEAKDLRIVMMISKMVADLERIGDKATNIAESVLPLVAQPALKPFVPLPQMKQETLKMLDDAISAFVNEDIQLAYNVLYRDDVVDKLRDQILRELISFMMSDSTVIERSLHLLRIARNLEKIADLTSNLCEEVIYIKEGRNIKHTTELSKK